MQLDKLLGLVKEKYPQWIFTNYRRYPLYESIKLEPFLQEYFKKKEMFLPVELIEKIRKAIVEKYKNEIACFVTCGVNDTITFSSLHYYQADVGIIGPQHTNMDEPVYVVKYHDKFILWNGYHRAFAKIMFGEKAINCKVLTA